MDKLSSKLTQYSIAVLLALATLAVYWQVRTHDLINYGDNLYITTDNSHVERPGVIRYLLAAVSLALCLLAKAMLGKVGRIDEAIKHFSEAIRLKPDYPQAHNDFGFALFSQGKIEEAIEHYTEALRMRPDYERARNNLSIALNKR